MADEEEQVAPTDPEVEEPTETPAEDDGDAAGERSLADLISEQNAQDVFQHPAVQALVQETVKDQVTRAADRTRNQIIAEQRRRFGDPEVVEAAAFDILRESGLTDVSRSQRDRLTNLFATFEEQAANKIAGEIPRVFMAGYKLPQDALATYHEKIAASDPDGAFQALIDGAIASKTAELEAANEKRIKTEVDKRVKAELEASSGEGPRSFPRTSKGAPATRVGFALTTAEIEKLPHPVWKALGSDVQKQLSANVAQADRERGERTVDIAVLERVMSLAK